jgi:hypothetical protein
MMTVAQGEENVRAVRQIRSLSDFESDWSTI